MEPDAALALARRLVREHGLEGWTVRLDAAKTRAGVCRFARREIGLSRPLTRLHSEEEVRDTILHEVAHALVGPEHGHDEVWRATARRIGCSGERCVSPDAPRVRGEWVGTCPVGHEVHRHRRPVRVRSCARCSTSFDPDAILTWTYRGHRAPMLDSYREELRAIRERYGRPAAGRAAGAPPVPARLDGPGAYAVGDAVRITRPGAYLGAVGTVELVSASRVQVRVGEDLLAAPFDAVEPVRSAAG